MYKCLNGQSPEAISAKFSYLRDCQSYNTRNCSDGMLSIPRFHTALFRNSFVYNGAVTWNNLPIYVRSSKSLFHFKQSYKQYYNAK